MVLHTAPCPVCPGCSLSRVQPVKGAACPGWSLSRVEPVQGAYPRNGKKLRAHDHLDRKKHNTNTKQLNEPVAKTRTTCTVANWLPMTSLHHATHTHYMPYESWGSRVQWCTSHHFKLTELAAKEEQKYTSHKYTSLLTFIVLRSKVVFEGITQLIQDSVTLKWFLTI